VNIGIFFRRLSLIASRGLVALRRVFNAAGNSNYVKNPARDVSPMRLQHSNP